MKQSSKSWIFSDREKEYKKKKKNLIKNIKIQKKNLWKKQKYSFSTFNNYSKKLSKQNNTWKLHQFRFKNLKLFTI